MLFWGGKADFMLYPVKNDDWQKQITRRPPLQKFKVMPLDFYKKPTFVPVLRIKRSLRRTFAFTKKKKKTKSRTRVQHLFGTEPLQSSVHWSSESGTAELLPQELCSTLSCHSFELCV